MKKRIEIGKIILMIICVIIPVTVAVLICSYSYKRHTVQALEYYYADTQKELEESDMAGLYEAYLTYTTKYFQKVISKEVKLEDKHLLDLNIYEVIEEVDSVDTLKYYFFAYNVNYLNLTEWKYPEDEDLKFYLNYIPTFRICMHDKDVTDTEEWTYTPFDEFSDVIIRDKGVSPLEDEDGISLENYNVQVASFSAINIPSDPCVLSISMVVNYEEETQDEEAVIEENWNMERVLIDVDDYSTFQEGFNNDILEAGYVGQMFKRFWWWETIVALAMVGVLCYSFYIVLTYKKEE